MKLLICGGRNIGRTNPNSIHNDAATEITRATQERNFVSEYLTKLHKEKSITVVIGGDEGGAERIGLNWAAANNVQTDVWARKTTRSGAVTKSIGILRGKTASSRETMMQRNARMLSGSSPDLVIAFGGGDSTAELVQQARRKGVQVLEISIPPLSLSKSS